MGKTLRLDFRYVNSVYQESHKNEDAQIFVLLKFMFV